MDASDTGVTSDTNDTSGHLEEALVRLHASGPERLGRLGNHAPMVVEVLAMRGHADAVHPWRDLHRARLEEFPDRVAPVTDHNWPSALGDPRRAGPPTGSATSPAPSPSTRGSCGVPSCMSGFGRDAVSAVLPAFGRGGPAGVTATGPLLDRYPRGTFLVGGLLTVPAWPASAEAHGRRWHGNSVDIRGTGTP